MKSVLKHALICSALSLSIVGPPARATVTFVGNDFTTDGAWRTADVIKTNDIDGDNVYGSDGYFLPGAETFGYANPLLLGTNTLITTAQFCIDALPPYVVGLQFTNAEVGSTWGGGSSGEDGPLDAVLDSLGQASVLVPSLGTTTNLFLSLDCSDAPGFRLTLIFGNNPNALTFFDTALSGTDGNTNIPNLDDPLGMYVTVNDGSGAVSQLSGDPSLAGQSSGFTTYQSWDISAGATNISITIGLNGTANAIPRLSGIAIDALPVTQPTILTPLSGAGTYYEGNPVVLTVVGGGTGIGYQWLFNSNVIIGATNWWEYTIPNTATNNSGNYQVVITNSVGSITSAVAVVNVLAPPTTIVYEDQFTGSGGALNGRFPDTFGTNTAWVAGTVWDYDGTEAYGSGTGNAYLPFVPEPGRIYTLSATIQDTTSDAGSWTAMGFAGSDGSLNSQWHTVNNPVGWTLVRGNSIANDPNQTFIGPGTDGGSAGYSPSGFTTYSVILDTTPASAANWTFTFTANGSVVRAATPFGGSGPTIDYVGLGMINANGDCYVQNFTLSQQVPFSPPFFSVEPVGGTNFVGENKTLSVTVGGSDPLSFQWQKNSNNISTATNSILTLTNLQPSDSGSYRVHVTNPLDLSAGGTNSAAASLLVVTPVVTTIYQDYFTNDSSGFLNGNPPDNVGTNTWVAAPAWGSDGTEAVVGTEGYGSVSANAFLPFVPQAGHVYTLSANIDNTGGDEWIALGFANGDATNIIWQGANNPVGWALERTDGSGQDNQAFVGPGTAGGTDTGFAPTGGLVNYAVILDTRPTNASAWTFTFQSNSNTLVGPTTFGGSGPTITTVGLGAYELVAGVVQDFTLTMATAPSQAPILKIARQGGSVILSWPTSAAGYSLSGSTALGSGASWQSVGGSPTVVNGTNQVTVPITGNAQFFRLAN
jgi:hypothetical protein